MTLEQTGSGLEARLQIGGITRFIGAAFLSFWLVGWAVGETFACSILCLGAWSLLTGKPLRHGHEPLGLAVALAGGLFLLFWLTIWTFGGLAAGRELLRLLFARDILLARHDALEITNSYGLFRSVKRLPREEIRRFYRTSPRAPLCAETTSGITVLTGLG
ncbi:MAG TPA: hypothetical protein VFA77_07945, partial [Candidatus Eisenbacteria bacterium]|nr:hypothetical protein [Candidatus Eisenbacteria bacterium]